MKAITYRIDKQGPTAQHRELYSTPGDNYNGEEYIKKYCVYRITCYSAETNTAL